MALQTPILSNPPAGFQLHVITHRCVVAQTPTERRQYNCANAEYVAAQWLFSQMATQEKQCTCCGDYSATLYRSPLRVDVCWECMEQDCESWDEYEREMDDSADRRAVGMW